MQCRNAKFRMHNANGTARARSIWRAVVCCFALCILHFALQRSVRQQQPGMPGSMGFTGGHRRLEHASRQSRTSPSSSAWASSCRSTCGSRTRADATSRSASTSASKRPVVLAFVYYQCPMLCTLVMNGISSTLKVAALHSRARNSTSCSSASIRATPRRRRTRRSARISSTGRPADGGRLALSHRRRGRDSAGHHRPPGSPISGTSRRAVRSRERCARGDAGRTLSRYFYGVEYLAKGSAAGAGGSGQGRWDRSSTSCCSIASITTPRHGRYGAAFMNIMRLGGVLTVGAHGRLHRADAATRDRRRSADGEARLS